jgi:putative FmdB family regulatory protein
MPVHEFTCASCGVFEQMRPVMQGDAPMTCPECGAPARRRFAAGRWRSAARIARTELDPAEASDRGPRRGDQPQRPWRAGR